MMKHSMCVLLMGLLVSVSSYAVGIENSFSTDAKASKAASQSICLNSTLPKVFTSAELDLNGDGYSDLAYVVNNPKNEDNFTFCLFETSDIDGDGYVVHGERKLTVETETFIEKVISGLFSMGEPKFSVRQFADGRPDSLVISTEYLNGRDRNGSEVVIANRNGKIVLAGLDWWNHDSLQEYGSRNCSINLLAKKRNFIFDGRTKIGLPLSGTVSKEATPIHKVDWQRLSSLVHANCPETKGEAQ